MSYRSITNDAELAELCGELAGRAWIALDTEFVAEHTFRPVLCLVQVAADDHLALIDAMAVGDMTPFWELLAAPGHETIVHAGRSEAEFCLQAVGRVPAGLFDVQVAAGLVGIEYPAGYSTLLARLLGKTAKSLETRTDWRRRPLSKRQIEYALEDVRHLRAMADVLRSRLEQLGRRDWMAEEMAEWESELRNARSRDHWHRVSGISGLGPRELAIVRELYEWRGREAQRRDQPARHVLRDDLIVELARRRSADVRQIRAVRGMERGDLLRRVNEIAASIARGLAVPEPECPVVASRQRVPPLSVLGQFLFAALGSLCRQREVAPALAGNPTDVRDWIVHRSGRFGPTETPRLARGWRKQFVGDLFDDLLAGRLAVRVADPESEAPLRFERPRHD